MVMFLFLVAALVVVIAAVTFAVIGGGDSGTLRDEPSQFYADPLPPDRPLDPADLEALRLPTAVRGYRMAEVDDALNRLGAELAERDARITELEAALTSAHTRAGPQPTERGPDTGYAPPGEYGFGYETGEGFR
ncbi:MULTISPECIES: DivIVA domain-containing protein [unclassified Streptomyces]|jgi:DivIVA domain-containing protein|uniref:DivIVA domain-containing protein n=1 Tax=unclassified Streptomyces TaxID=2593676 RepID=UPI00224D666F|nr:MULTISPECIES: DivIVA domain-containing protein [unclassified Streptomyces]MCX4829160.1 DivIVA domain-containing protein [Streptomyces sp. NBC_01016]